jgi:DNA-binding MarR family transcriptional regulator
MFAYSKYDKAIGSSWPDLVSGKYDNMNSDLTKREQKSTHYLKAFIGDTLQMLSVHFKGETTINHLRIGHYIGFMSLYKGEATSNKDIADALGIPRSTVSRIVGDCIQKGWVIEKPHPEDARKRQLEIIPGHPLADNFEKDFRDRLNQMMQLFQCGKLVPVDPLKKSF